MSEELSLIQLSARAPAVSMRDVLVIIFRQRRLLLISFVITFLAVLLYGLLTPSYQAQMKVLVRRGRIDPVVTSTPTQPPLFREEVTEEELNSEVELLRDEQIREHYLWPVIAKEVERAYWRTMGRQDVSVELPESPITAELGAPRPDMPEKR
jgi:hypothetical protein